MNYSMNMYSNEFFNPYEVINSICLGGPNHMQIMDIGDGDYLRVPEFPSIDIHTYSPADSVMADSTVDIHTYNKRIIYIRGFIRGFRACIYLHSEISDDEIDQWLYNYYPDIYRRIRYDHDSRCYKFFNSPSVARYIHDHQDSIDAAVEWYTPPAGHGRGVIAEWSSSLDRYDGPKEAEKPKKIKIKLDDKLFEL